MTPDQPLADQGGGPAAGPVAPAVTVDYWFAAAVAEIVVATQERGSDGSRVLQVIVDGAVDLIPGAEAAGASTVTNRGRLQARAAAGTLHPLVLEMQNQVGVGPCFDASSQNEAVHLQDTETENRWPEFTSAAVKVGVRSMLCTPLIANGRVIGSLSVLSTKPDAFGAEATELARIFAIHAAAAIAGGQYRTDLEEGLASRDVIGQAKGMLMERFHLTADVAFSVLVRTSQHTNIKIREVCRHLCETGSLPG